MIALSLVLFVVNYAVVSNVLSNFVVELEAMRFPNRFFQPIALHTSYLQDIHLFYKKNSTLSPSDQNNLKYIEQFL